MDPLAISIEATSGDDTEFLTLVEVIVSSELAAWLRGDWARRIQRGGSNARHCLGRVSSSPKDNVPAVHSQPGACATSLRPSCNRSLRTSRWRARGPRCRAQAQRGQSSPKDRSLLRLRYVHLVQFQLQVQRSRQHYGLHSST